MTRRSRKKESRRQVKRAGKSWRWLWAALCLASFLVVVSLAVAASDPAGSGSLTVHWLFALSRTASSLFGRFTAFVALNCLMISGVKFIDPSGPVPRFLRGTFLAICSAACLWHAMAVDRSSWLFMGAMGEGGGLMGAYVAWLLAGIFGRAVAALLLSAALLAGICIAAGKPAWTPLSLIGTALAQGWAAFVEMLRDFTRPVGPAPEDVETFRDEEDFEGETGEEPGVAVLEKTTPIDRPGSRIHREDTGQSYAGAPRPTGTVREPAVRSGGTEARDGSGSSPVYAQQPVRQVPLSDVLFYELPPLSLLDKSPPAHTRSERDIQEKARIIEDTLASFGIRVKVVNFSRGPAVTRFELQPAPGTKVSAIVNRSQDIALALAASDVRVEAPIPGKAAVGIEVPNREVSLVHLREVLESPAFRESQSPLTLALGKDISGKPVVTTLDHLIHLLIAGATGSGKSVCINSIIASILYKARPDQVKLLLIDPKRVELSAWSSVPHLVAPVVYDPRKAAGALRWAIKEMQSRYEAFARFGVRDVDRYNQVATPPGSPRPAMPYLVIIVDELSDLMVVAPAEVEDSIFRLAQMARAAGIHLVLATQRPSVDVLTGTIKANIPSRIAFAVSSQIDSRTILDATGAEKLLGRGDMLFLPVGAVRPLRAQGTYISEREIDELVSFTSRQARPQYAPGILQEPDPETERTDGETDPLFTQALRIVVEAKQASVSLLQRRLPIGYSRAARLIDAMERRGFVGPYEGSKPREVKLTLQQYMRMFETRTSEGEGAPSRPPFSADREEPAVKSQNEETEHTG